MTFSKSIIKPLMPAAFALVLFFIVSAAYFAPQFRSEVLSQHDVTQYEGMTKDINEMRKATGEDPQWTGRMFGGMPAFLINVAYPAQLVKNTVGKIVKIIDTPAAFLFFAMTAMWLMMLMFGVNPWVGIVAALAYGFSTYFILIIGAGHITKMWAMVYAPLMMGGAFMTLRGNMWVGGVITALAASLQIGANHPQITYYFLLAMAALWISEGVFAVREKYLKDFARRTAVLAAAGLLAVGSNFSPLWYTAKHTPQTIRGGSELASDEGVATGGLDLEYATAWSYGRAELFNLLIPDFMGRDSATAFSANGEVAAALNEYGLRDAAQQLPAYWGDQPYTGGPTYLGAAVIFLALLGILLARGREKWWIIAVSVLMILLALGRNMMWFTELAFDWLPGYNKFRTVSMALVVVQWSVPLLAAFALSRLWSEEVSRKKILWSAGIVGGICLLFAVAGGLLFDFGRAESSEMMRGQFHRMLQANDMQEYIDQGMDIEMGMAVGNAMAAERISMMQADAWRSLLMILLAAGGVLLFAMRKISRYVFVIAIGAVVLMDLVPVNLRFLSHSDFVPERRAQIIPSAADKTILADKELGFRVFNITVSPFQDATTSYFHRSIGGYHGAKLARYQDLIDNYLSYGNDEVLDMLNTRYLIIPSSGGAEAIRRETALGAAWFVDNIVYAANAHEEIALLGEVDLKTTAVVAGKERVSFIPSSEGEGVISLVEYRPNYLKYEYSSPGNSVVVFSEIYYPYGWRSYIDGVEVSNFRADYILRAMEVPAGDHTIEWRFRAPAWKKVEAVTLVCSLIILLGGVAVLIYTYRKYKGDCGSSPQ